MTAAILDVLGEPGGDRVQKILADCAMTAVNLGEVVGHSPGSAPPRPTFA